MARESLGLLGYESYTFVVENLERSRNFYASKFDFREVARASQARSAQTGESAVVFGAGEARVLVTSPLSQSSAAARYLRRHPAGISQLTFRVKDLDQTRATLARRGATFLGDDVDVRDAQGGRYRSASIATPLGDVAFGFVERTDFADFAPGFEASPAEAGADVRRGNRFGIQRVDHVTSNARTMKPVIDWYREVLGMEQFWDVQFHTDDMAPGREGATGLKSIVMWEPESGVKFATNEPLAPHFDRSQIAKFCYDNHGPGLQHIAFSVPDIISTVDELKRLDVQFLHTPHSYFRDMPERLRALKISNVREDLATLGRLEILVDGADDKYMLQIFLKEAAGLYDDERAGPFFYEIIQREGDEGFGYGNFRALFESIERDQKPQLAGSPPG
jgi:4-hydroxyphenylpyruvate dioxygenase